MIFILICLIARLCFNIVTLLLLLILLIFLRRLQSIIIFRKNKFLKVKQRRGLSRPVLNLLMFTQKCLSWLNLLLLLLHLLMLIIIILMYLLMIILSYLFEFVVWVLFVLLLDQLSEFGLTQISIRFCCWWRILNTPRTSHKYKWAFGTIITSWGNASRGRFYRYLIITKALWFWR